MPDRASEVRYISSASAGTVGCRRLRVAAAASWALATTESTRVATRAVRTVVSCVASRNRERTERGVLLAIRARKRSAARGGSNELRRVAPRRARGRRGATSYDARLRPRWRRIGAVQNNRAEGARAVASPSEARNFLHCIRNGSGPRRLRPEATEKFASAPSPTSGDSFKVAINHAQRACKSPPHQAARASFTPVHTLFPLAATRKPSSNVARGGRATSS